MPPPIRTTDKDYHYHTYDFTSAESFTLSPPLESAGERRFYSMVKDLQGLQVTGMANRVPNIVLTPLDPPIEGEDRNPRNVWALSFGGPTPRDNTSPDVVITGGIHAREWVAAEMAYLLAEYLIVNYSPHGGTIYEQNIRNLVNNRRIHILPMLNPNGNHKTVFEHGDRMWRKNCRRLPATPQEWVTALSTDGNPNPPFRNIHDGGSTCRYDVPRYEPGVPPGQATYNTETLLNGYLGVDLNRNFSTQAFGYDARQNASSASDSYFGPEQSSEQETCVISQYVRTRASNLRVAIDYHSYARVILFPSEASDRGVVNGRYRRLGKTMRELTKDDKGKYLLGNPRNTIGYDATGTLSDFLSISWRARAFVIELDPAFDGDDSDSGFKLPETEIRGVFERNIRPALALIAAAGESTTYRFGRPTNDAGQRAYLSWNVFGRGNQLPEA